MLCAKRVIIGGGGKPTKFLKNKYSFLFSSCSTFLFISLIFLSCKSNTESSGGGNDGGIDKDPKWNLLGAEVIDTAIRLPTETVNIKANLAFDNNNTPYISYDIWSKYDKRKVTAKRFINGSWQSIGDVSGSSDTYGKASMAISSRGVPYVSYLPPDHMNNTLTITLKKYENHSWILMTDSMDSSLDVKDISKSHMAMDSKDVPYTAFLFKTPPSIGAQTLGVLKYDNGSWKLAGNQNNFNNPSIKHWNVSMVIDSKDVPYAISEDYDNGKAATVMKYDKTSDNWILVGTKGFNSPNIIGSSGSASTIITIDNNDTPYIAYIDYNDTSLEYYMGNVTVMKFNSSSWVKVGVEGSAPIGFNNLAMAFDKNNTPHIAYTDTGSGQKLSTVMKFNGTSWEVIGEKGLPIGEYNPTIESLVFDNNNVLHLAYTHETAHYYGDFVLTVMKFDNKY